MKPDRIEHEILLLVEGNDARNFFEALGQHLKLAAFDVKDFGGVDELHRYLKTLVRQQEFRKKVRRLGIVRDAETSDEPAKTAGRAFQSVQSALENAGLPVPDKPAEFAESRGPDAGRPAVAVLILPDGDRQGTLETLLCETFVGGAVDRCVDDFLRCVEESDGPSPRPAKAKAHAYLATRPHPHVSVGVAAQKGYWDLEHTALEGVRGFLTSLHGSAE